MSASSGKEVATNPSNVPRDGRRGWGGYGTAQPRRDRSGPRRCLPRGRRPDRRPGTRRVVATRLFGQHVPHNASKKSSTDSPSRDVTSNTYFPARTFEAPASYD